MLDAFIIEELRRREERERSEEDRPALELPVERGDERKERPRRDDKKGDRERGVVIIDI